MSYRDVIVSEISEVFREEGIAPPSEFSDDMILLELGLDSLGYAVLVTKLLDRLGFDPFVDSDVPFYPSTFGDFVAFYDSRNR
jgi:acyl carrier protein